MLMLACLLSLGAGGVPIGSTHEGPDSTAVPIELVDGHRAVVRATLDGRGPYRLAVETGSPNVQLSPHLVRELALTHAGGGARDSLFRLDSLRIGSVIVQGLAVGSDKALERIGVDGVLGLDAYADLLLTVDYPAARLVLSRDTLPAPDGADVLPAVRVGPFIGIPVDAGGTRAIGVVDTQGGILFQAVPEEARRLTFSAPPRVVGRAIVGGGAPVEVREARLAGDLKLGRHVFHQPSIAVHPLPADIPSRMTIGTQALRHFRLTIDQRSMRVRLTRADAGAIVE
ncbi:MAG TPA: hypothetical protein VFJ81_04045 [Gemmatimonadales bacterium]|nr:hypothetical protein [Gemmatimonadales bacterium]